MLLARRRRKFLGSFRPLLRNPPLVIPKSGTRGGFLTSIALIFSQWNWHRNSSQNTTKYQNILILSLKNVLAGGQILQKIRPTGQKLDLWVWSKFPQGLKLDLHRSKKKHCGPGTTNHWYCPIFQKTAGTRIHCYSTKGQQPSAGTSDFFFSCASNLQGYGCNHVAVVRPRMDLVIIPTLRSHHVSYTAFS